MYPLNRIDCKLFKACSCDWEIDRWLIFDLSFVCFSFARSLPRSSHCDARVIKRQRRRAGDNFHPQIHAHIGPTLHWTEPGNIYLSMTTIRRRGNSSSLSKYDSAKARATHAHLVTTLTRQRHFRRLQAATRSRGLIPLDTGYRQTCLKQGASDSCVQNAFWGVVTNPNG